MTTETIRPRPGSHIWRRTDNGPLTFSYRPPGSEEMAKLPGATPYEITAAELRNPEGWFIDDGRGHATEVERILNQTAVYKRDEPIVVLGPTKPSFGEWEELSEWTP